VRLHGSHLLSVFGAILPFGHIEDHGMGMKLRRRVAIDGSRGIVFESGGDEFSGRLRGMHIADPRLRVALKFVKRCADTLAMGYGKDRKDPSLVISNAPPVRRFPFG
jgi:hypothetical protein